MPKLKDLLLRERLQFQMLVALSIGAAGLIAILYCTNAQLFQRYDFMAMHAFRLVYYLTWHIVWGYARLKLLF